MPDDELDPAADTQMFQAFVDHYPEPETSRSVWMWAALAGVAVVIVLVLWLVLRA